MEHRDFATPAPTVAPLNDMFNEAQAAALLGVSRRTLANWRWLREGPRFLKLGKRCVRYQRCDLEQFIAGARGQQAGAP